MPVATIPDAFEAVPSRALLRTAQALTGQRADAEDLLQSALVKALPHWRQITGEPEGYLYRVMVNEHISRWRRHRGREVLRAEVPDRSSAGPDIAEQVAVRRALGALPPRQRAVLVLRYYEDLTESETARALGVSVGTVKSQHRKALTTLRAALSSSDGIGAFSA